VVKREVVPSSHGAHGTFSILKRIERGETTVKSAVLADSFSFSILKRIERGETVNIWIYEYVIRAFQYPQADRAW